MDLSFSGIYSNDPSRISFRRLKPGEGNAGLPPGAIVTEKGDVIVFTPDSGSPASKRLPRDPEPPAAAFFDVTI